jgi:NAD(P)-dependent dehydrogenase (short-subunit alcohol dehydrogenase family)
MNLWADFFQSQNPAKSFLMSNKTAIITGASAGIGRAVATIYAAHNYNLTLVALEREELLALAKDLESTYNIQCLVCCGNLVEKEFLRSIIDATVQRFGSIDVLVNNAAWRTIETMRSMEFEHWEQTLGICLTAPAFLSKWSAEVMEQNSIQGTIINVSTVMSGRAGGISPAYLAAKGGLESLTYELAVTYGRSSIRVICVQPGNIDTHMSNDYTNADGENISSKLGQHVIDLTPASRAGKPEEVAEAIYWLSTDKASYITGTTLTIDGGLSHNFNAYSMKRIQFPNEF